MTKRLQAVVTAITLSALMTLNALPAMATQKKTAKKPPAKTAKVPATPYGKGYQSGYAAGYTQGGQDWRNNATFDFRGSKGFQERERADSQYNSSAMYSQGYDLGFQIGYGDAYYGRSKNLEVPANGEVIARASGLPARDTRDTGTVANAPNNTPNYDR